MFILYFGRNLGAALAELSLPSPPPFFLDPPYINLVYIYIYVYIYISIERTK